MLPRRRIPPDQRRCGARHCRPPEHCLHHWPVEELSAAGAGDGGPARGRASPGAGRHCHRREAVLRVPGQHGPHDCLAAQRGRREAHGKEGSRRQRWPSHPSQRQQRQRRGQPGHQRCQATLPLQRRRPHRSLRRVCHAHVPRPVSERRALRGIHGHLVRVLRGPGEARVAPQWRELHCALPCTPGAVARSSGQLPIRGGLLAARQVLPAPAHLLCRAGEPLAIPERGAGPGSVGRCRRGRGKGACHARAARL
mmetsp:Transcript_131202/g.185097  ORF Transcript_131202/g.185097 Transcript_131202/m.185097 type:complete len:253 (+) Transcript_131202:111-869(+)